MPSPTLVEVTRCEERIHELLEGVRALVAQERVELLGRRRYSDQRDVDTARKRATIGIGGRSKPLRLELREQKRVDR